MIRPGTVTGIIFCVLLLTGCDDGLTLSKHVELKHAMERWSALQYHSYRYETRALCFCPPEMAQWSQITVVDGRVSRVVVVETGAEVDTAFFFRYPTIDEQFLSIWFMHSGDIEVEYDPFAGYPTVIDIPADPRATDTGFRRYSQYLIRVSE